MLLSLQSWTFVYFNCGVLTGDALNNEATLKRLMGENREEYERKLRERLARRKQRLAEGKVLLSFVQ